MNEIYTRKVEKSDLPALRRIYDSAKNYMNETGNATQWRVGYPPSEMLEADIEQGQLYVICGSDGAHAVFAMIPGVDPTYLKIDGAWLNSRPYAAIHRVASDGKIRRVVAQAVEFTKASHPELDIRIDTHENNRPMQTALSREGFVKCGIIHLANGDPRIAFQLVTEAK